jgi:isoleucyl-tRNA synthetase
VFTSLPDKPDHDGLERSILDFWSSEGVFERLREKNADGPTFSFIDGPVTANKVLGVHTAWGRTLKDVFQRYKALRGFHQRFQNGFDCQGLWIEVGVERELGLNSKREIEEYGLEAFARRCRAVVERSAEDLIAGSIRLGQWMDWGRDYFTFSDTNIEYIWRFLRIVHERGWLYRGHRATEWCPRCGTSISTHELVGSYVDREDPSLRVRLPLVDRPGEALVIWTTTPWTLPANVAAAVKPDADYGRLANGDWVGVGVGKADDTDDEDEDEDDGQYLEVKTGAELVGWAYQGPFDDLGPGAAVEHRVIPWDEVSLDEGTGIVHIAPGCGTEDFGLAEEHGLAVLTPVDEAGRFYPQYGWLAGLGARDAAERIIEDLDRRSLLVSAGTITHRYPECWRCHTPLIFRISDDWFISVDELRGPMREANRTVEWIPSYMGLRMDDWLVNMSDWNISRRRYYGLPLPFYPCACGHLTVIGSRHELEERAASSLDGLEELRRPWIDAIKIRCEGCGEEIERVVEVGDVWLDAGIVPFSTLGWENPEWIDEGYATGAARGLTTADLPDHAYWERWFPADWVSEMREQIRLWFYSQLFMSVALTGRAPYKKVLGYEKMLDEQGREMHGSWGNAISADDAFSQMGADVMRWLYCAQPPNQNLLFGFGPGKEVRRRLLTLWNSASFLVQYANTADFTPTIDDLWSPPAADLQPLDEWLVERTAQLVADATAAYDGYLSMNVVRAFEDYIDDMSNWYIRRSRRRFWDGDPTALRTLWFALVRSLQVISPVMPFLAEHLWQILVADVCPDAPRSVFLAGWPAVEPVDEERLAEVVELRRIVELGRRARSTAGLRLRQPLRQLVIEGATRVDGHVGEIAAELRVKDVRLGRIDATRPRVRPKLPVVGPRLGPDVVAVRKALEAGEFRELDDGGVEVAGHRLSVEEILVERTTKAGWAIAAEDGLTVALDTTLDDELSREARVYDTIHLVNTLRKEAGLALADRIKLELPASDADLLDFHDWIAAETLAVAIALAPDNQIHLERV